MATSKIVHFDFTIGIEKKVIYNSSINSNAFY